MRQKPEAIAPPTGKNFPALIVKQPVARHPPKPGRHHLQPVFLHRTFPIGIVDHLAGRRPVKAGAFNHPFDALIAANINPLGPRHFAKGQQQVATLAGLIGHGKSE